MSKRLQILVVAEEAETYRKMARSSGLSLGEWVRRALRRAAGQERRKPAQKLQALDRALACGHPTGSIGQVLEEIERGRGLR